MEDDSSVPLDGKVLPNLRVVDLKHQLEKRGLSKSGSKKDLVKRLKQQLDFEKLCEERKSSGDFDSKIKLDAATEQNEFVQQYLAQQQKRMEEKRLSAEASQRLGDVQSKESSEEQVTMDENPVSDTDKGGDNIRQRDKCYKIKLVLTKPGEKSCGVKVKTSETVEKHSSGYEGHVSDTIIKSVDISENVTEKPMIHKSAVEVLESITELKQGPKSPVNDTECLTILERSPQNPVCAFESVSELNRHPKRPKDVSGIAIKQKKSTVDASEDVKEIKKDPQSSADISGYAIDMKSGPGDVSQGVLKIKIGPKSPVDVSENVRELDGSCSSFIFSKSITALKKCRKSLDVSGNITELTQGLKSSDIYKNITKGSKKPKKRHSSPVDDLAHIAKFERCAESHVIVSEHETKMKVGSNNSFDVSEHVTQSEKGPENTSNVYKYNETYLKKGPKSPVDVTEHITGSDMSYKSPVFSEHIRQFSKSPESSVNDSENKTKLKKDPESPVDVLENIAESISDMCPKSPSDVYGHTTQYAKSFESTVNDPEDQTKLKNNSRSTVNVSEQITVYDICPESPIDISEHTTQSENGSESHINSYVDQTKLKKGENNSIDVLECIAQHEKDSESSVNVSEHMMLSVRGPKSPVDDASLYITESARDPESLVNVFEHVIQSVRGHESSIDVCETITQSEKCLENPLNIYEDKTKLKKCPKSPVGMDHTTESKRGTETPATVSEHITHSVRGLVDVFEHLKQSKKSPQSPVIVYGDEIKLKENPKSPVNVLEHITETQKGPNNVFEHETQSEKLYECPVNVSKRTVQSEKCAENLVNIYDCKTKMKRCPMSPVHVLEHITRCDECPESSGIVSDQIIQSEKDCASSVHTPEQITKFEKGPESLVDIYKDETKLERGPKSPVDVSDHITEIGISPESPVNVSEHIIQSWRDSQSAEVFEHTTESESDKDSESRVNIYRDKRKLKKGSTSPIGVSEHITEPGKGSKRSVDISEHITHSKKDSGRPFNFSDKEPRPYKRSRSLVKPSENVQLCTDDHQKINLGNISIVDSVKDEKKKQRNLIALTQSSNIKEERDKSSKDSSYCSKYAKKNKQLSPSDVFKYLGQNKQSMHNYQSKSEKVSTIRSLLFSSENTEKTDQKSVNELSSHSRGHLQSVERRSSGSKISVQIVTPVSSSLSHTSLAEKSSSNRLCRKGSMADTETAEHSSPKESPHEVPYVPRKVSLSNDRKLSRKSSEDSVEPKVKKSKWGSFASKKSSQTISISTDSLKNWFPDFKLINESTTPMELDQEDHTVPAVEEKPTQPESVDEIDPGLKPVSTSEVDADDAESQEPNMEELSDQGPVSKMIFIQNLVRPFTLNQLKNLLKQTGNFVEESFWIDKIKSKCFVTYESEKEAIKTRNALNNTRWPSSNPKILTVEFSNEEELENHKKGNEHPPKPAPEPLVQPPESTAAKDLSIEERRKERERRREREKKKSHVPVREWDKDKVMQESPERQTLKEEKPRSSEKKEKKESKKRPSEDTSAKLLDDLFQKTKSTPCIYWLPLTEEQAQQKEDAKKMRKLEREKKIQQMKEQEESDRRSKRTRSPRRSREKASRKSPTRSRSPVTRRR